mmetsp:Transcript_16773/g.14706  ORF Transcript_16773/g.14706 Transcript_16773/m.14706 type:complete len:175 (-) Transcript_16773:32-556(-)
MVLEQFPLRHLLALKRMAEMNFSNLQIAVAIPVEDKDEEEFSSSPHLDEKNSEKEYECNIILLTKGNQDADFQLYWDIDGFCTFKPPANTKSKNKRNRREVDLTNQRFLPDFYGAEPDISENPKEERKKEDSSSSKLEQKLKNEKALVNMTENDLFEAQREQNFYDGLDEEDMF